MKTLFFTLCSLCVASISWADMTAFNQNPSAPMAPIIQITDSTPNPELATDLKKITVGSSTQKEKPVLVKKETAVKVTRVRYKFTPADFEQEMAADNARAFNRPAAVSKYADFVNSVSPEYKVNRNFLNLTKIPQERRKRAIMLVFLMNKAKVDPNKTVVAKYDQTRSRLHIMGSKKLFPEQKVIDDEYPLDISIARYDDGYSNDEWNLILPGKKPREILVSFLWNF